MRELEIIFPELKKEVLAKQKETHRLYDGLVRVQEQQEKEIEQEQREEELKAREVAGGQGAAGAPAAKKAFDEFNE